MGRLEMAYYYLTSAIGLLPVCTLRTSDAYVVAHAKDVICSLKNVKYQIATRFQVVTQPVAIQVEAICKMVILDSDLYAVLGDFGF